MISTPGHTIGCACYYIESLKILFSGDTLFFETYGRTDLPTGDFKTIAQSINSKLMNFPNEVKIDINKRGTAIKAIGLRSSFE